MESSHFETAAARGRKRRRSRPCVLLIAAMLLAFLPLPLAATADAETVTRRSPGFMTGIDANYALYLSSAAIDTAAWREVADRETIVTWRAGEGETDLLAIFAARGVDAFRVRVWVGETGPHGLLYALEVARRAREAGMTPYPVLFLSDRWADLVKQPRPAAWSGLDRAGLLEAVRRHAVEVANRFLEQGIRPPFWQVGNEIDFGICGYFPARGIAQVSDTERLAIWREEADVIRAAVTGIRSVDPGAQILLHLGMTWVPDFCAAFHAFLERERVPYDLLGLSYYPSSPPMNGRGLTHIRSLVARLHAQTGRRVVIAEYAFPNRAAGADALFADWNHAVDGHGPSPEAQHDAIARLLAWARSDTRVAGAFYWSPEWYTPGRPSAGWSSMSLFDAEGRALPALEAFRGSPASSEVSASR